ncbi:hypothetical protein [Streptomyces sp. CA-106131]|uniref:hypothetical protein n=1 Tax=Streptomyces sp. CA-106131 TaxID=3240045 RepID=UPI003D8EE561
MGRSPGSGAFAYELRGTFPDGIDGRDTAALSPGERCLLHEWLKRLADAEAGDD